MSDPLPFANVTLLNTRFREIGRNCNMEAAFEEIIASYVADDFASIRAANAADEALVLIGFAVLTRLGSEHAAGVGSLLLEAVPSGSMIKTAFTWRYSSEGRKRFMLRSSRGAIVVATMRDDTPRMDEFVARLNEIDAYVIHSTGVRVLVRPVRIDGAGTNLINVTAGLVFHDNPDDVFLETTEMSALVSIAIRINQHFNGDL